MKPKCRDGQWSFRHGQYVYPFDPADEAGKRLAETSCRFGVPPIDPELFAPALDCGVLFVRGLTSGNRYLLFDSLRKTFVRCREEAIRQETEYLVKQHRDYQANKFDLLGSHCRSHRSHPSGRMKGKHNGLQTRQ